MKYAMVIIGLLLLVVIGYFAATSPMGADSPSEAGTEKVESLFGNEDSVGQASPGAAATAPPGNRVNLQSRTSAPDTKIVQGAPVSSGNDIDCCSCDFSETRDFLGEDDFPCKFSYPAHWEARYYAHENAVYVTAPRCESLCDGTNRLHFRISPGRGVDRNFEQEEDTWEALFEIAGQSSCGGRSLVVYRSADPSPQNKKANLQFHVGKNDGLTYDARVQLACANAGEWRNLETLILESLR